MSNNTQQLYRFVKASERLPEESGLYVIRNTETKEYNVWSKSRLSARQDAIKQFGDTGMEHRIEWLEELPLPSNDAEQQRDNESYWERRCKAAENYIDNSPCDPDITSAQIIAYQNWQRVKTEILPAETNTLESAEETFYEQVRGIISKHLVVRDNQIWGILNAVDDISYLHKEYASQYKAQQQVDPVMAENIWDAAQGRSKHEFYGESRTPEQWQLMEDQYPDKDTYLSSLNNK